MGWEWENRVGLFKPKDRNFLHPKSPSDAGWQYPGLGVGGRLLSMGGPALDHGVQMPIQVLRCEQLLNDCTYLISSHLFTLAGGLHLSILYYGNGCSGGFRHLFGDQSRGLDPGLFASEAPDPYSGHSVTKHISPGGCWLLFRG